LPKTLVARPKKAVHFKLKPFTNASGTNSWQVTGTSPDGTRIRKNFREKSEAVQTLADLEMEAGDMPEKRLARRTSLSPQQLADAESACEQAGLLKLSKIVSHYLNLRNRAGEKGVSLDSAFAFFEARYRPETKVVSIMNAREEFLDSRVGISTNTRRNYESCLRLLLKPDPNKPVHQFTVSDIESAVSAYKNINSRKSHQRIFSIFFSWAVRHHYCLEDPCKRLDKLPKDMSRIAVLSVEEVRRLLYAAISYQDGAAVAPVAIALFAGLRPSEIAELESSDIRTGKIRVSGGKLRRKLKRAVPITPNLKTWLKNYPFKGLPKGWDYKFKKLKAATKASAWVPDILRHTSITYQVERDQNEALTAFSCGTSIQMIDRHYRETVEDSAALAAFWSMTPAKILAEKQDIELPKNQRISWPSKSVLKKLVWQKPLMHVAAELNASNVALKKRCTKLGIELPPSGYWLRRRPNR
jgi:integrase